MRTKPWEYIPCPELHVFIDLDELKKFANEKYQCDVGIINKDGFTSSLVRNMGELACLVYIKHQKYGNGQLAGLAAHEATHVSQEFFESIGEDKPSSEMQAYYVQAFTICIIQAYEKLAKGKK